MLTINTDLARRLEMTDALAGVEFASAWAKRNSFDKQPWIEVAGGFGGFAGVDSPVTQAFGLGFAGEVAEAEIVVMEDFYRELGSAVNIETCPLADASLFEMLAKRGYRQIEESNVFARELTAGDHGLWSDNSNGILISAPTESQLDEYLDVVVGSFFENVEVTPELFELFRAPFYAAGAHFFLAYIGGTPAGAAMMSVHRGVASLGGAGTLPEFRNRGVQNALILARLASAAKLGCDLAMVATGIETGSQRNVERRGFGLVYRRVKFIREWR